MDWHTGTESMEALALMLHHSSIDRYYALRANNNVRWMALALAIYLLSRYLATKFAKPSARKIQQEKVRHAAVWSRGQSMAINS